MAKKKKAAKPDLPVWAVGMVAELKAAGKYQESMDPAAIRAAYNKLLEATPDPEPPPKTDAEKYPLPSTPGNPQPHPYPMRVVHDVKLCTACATHDLNAGLEAARKDMRDAVLRTHVKLEPPCDPKTILDVTEVEGKMVRTWATKYEAAETSRADLNVFPGWVPWYVQQWVARGRPTNRARLLQEYNHLKTKIDEKKKDIEAAKEKAETAPIGKSGRYVDLAKQRTERLSELEAEASAVFLVLQKTG